MRRDDPLAYTHQTVVHQLRHAAKEIEDGDGLVMDFDYDENMGAGISDTTTTERTVTVELTFLLPE